MRNDVFSRKEIKFLVTERERESFDTMTAMRIIPDAYGESTICNLYYDTPDFRLIRRSLEHPVYKEKLRMRSYGQVAEGAPVYLELKRKYKGIVYKRRISLTEEKASLYRGGERPPQDSQVGREIRTFYNYYEELAPRVYLSYDRSAFFSREDPNLRITFDSNLRFRETDLRLTEPPGGTELLPEGKYLMEIKAASGLPEWLLAFLNFHSIRKISFSKYGSAYLKMLESRSFFDRIGWKE